MDRRKFMVGSGTAIAASAVGLGAASLQSSKSAASTRVALKLQKARYKINTVFTENMVSLSPDRPPPVIWMDQYAPFAADVTNGLSEYTAMHWHGIRLPNKMDGVPYLTQLPLGQNDTYHYRFTPDDAGTYWYHPHCMTMEQMARGLTGVLIVREKDDPKFDADIPINLRDFRLKSDDQFTQLFTMKGAARGGTKGTVITANWRKEYQESAPAGGLVRLRLVASDPTRNYKIAMAKSDGKVIALDGHPLSKPWSLPTEAKPLILSPGQRADIALVMPREEGKEIVISTMLGQRARTLSRIRSKGSSLNRKLNDLRPLKPNPLSVPDLKKAELHEFVFGWSPDENGPNNGLCGSMEFTFWSINRKPWPGDAVKDTGPLLTMKQGRSYVLRLRNESPNHHPIHLHGMTFITLRSNKRKITPTWSDTVLLGRNETVEIAVVADNPGDWAFHCHVIEHQKTGLAGFVRVE
ncbi:MAG: copper oxidase [Rhodospirillaceae bacterium]|nr:copper oxidase [Rhodospirillaceae bacterium]